MKSKGKRIIAYFRATKRSTRLIVSALLVGSIFMILGITVYKQREVLLTYKWQIHPVPLVISFVLFSLTLFIGSFVWGYILNSISQKSSYRKHIYNYSISNLAKRLPGTIWYVASRAQMYSEEGIPLSVTTLASGLEMTIIAIAGIITVLIFSTEIIFRYRLNPLIFVFILFIGLIILQPSFIKWFLKFFKIEGIKINYPLILVGLLTYIIVWMIGGFLLFEITNIIYPLPVQQIGYVIGSWTLVGVISILFIFSPSNFGVTELGLSLLLSSIIPFSIAVVISVLSRILIIIFEIIWALVFLGLNRLKKIN